MERGACVKDAKDIFCEAMLQLLQKKPFEEIRVKGLLERAGLNKSSYYYHFSRLEDVVELIIERFVRGAEEQFRTSAETTIAGADGAGQGRLNWTHFFDFVYENRRVYLVLWHSSYGPQFIVWLKNGLLEATNCFQMVCTDEEGERYIPTQAERDYFSHGLAYLVLSILEVWAQHDFEEPSSVVCQTVQTILNAPITDFYTGQEREVLPVRSWQETVWKSKK